MVVHPQSIIHSLIQLNDGASLAHLGYPDMRVPISYALHYPERADVPVEPLDLARARAADLRGARRGRVPLPAAGPRGRHAGRHRALRAERRQRGRGAGLPRRRAAVHRHRRGDRARARGDPGRPVGHFSDLYKADAAAREQAAELIHGVAADVSWFIAFAGFCALIILHELGHFTAAKAVGMRVERFSLFFPPLIARKKVGRDRVRDRRRCRSAAT